MANLSTLENHHHVNKRLMKNWQNMNQTNSEPMVSLVSQDKPGNAENIKYSIHAVYCEL